MIRKALYKIAIFIGVLVALIWTSRLWFHWQINGIAGLSQVFSFKYLYVSILFDLKTIAIWYSPVFLFLIISLFVKHRIIKWATSILLFILSLALLLFNFVAVLYYPITKTIVGKDLFYMISGQESAIVWGYVASYWYLVLLLLAVCYWVTGKLMRIELELGKRQWFAVVPILLLLWALTARGSVSLKPLNHLDAYAALPSEQAVSAMNPSFILLESLFQVSLEELDFLEPTELADLQKDDLVSYEALLQESPNICLILLESFGKEYTGLHNLDIPSYTPFLDSLASKSIEFENAFSNGLRSMDAVSSIYNGVPTLMREAFVGSVYAHIQLHSVFKFLKDKGYYSSFFHAADEGSMGFKSYLLSQGLDEYNAQQQYPEKAHHDGHWGILDQPYFQYVVDKFTDQKEPWFSSFFSLSSHHPYMVPEGYEHLQEGSLEIHRSIRYTDESLRDFFKSAKETNWFKRTIFIITADHSSINETQEYSTISGKYEVPLLIYAPAIFEPREVERAVQHIDFLPTIWHLFGIEEEQFSFGKSLLDSVESTVVNFDGALYSLTNDNRNLSWSGNEVMGYYNQREDRKHEFLIGNEPEEQQKLLYKLKSRVQNFNHRILTNTYH
ncbi:MAG: sulfatase-like hydrolase/transferase [Bacteroidia bacterium]